MAKQSLRYNFPQKWNVAKRFNRAFFGISEMSRTLSEYFNQIDQDKVRMLEIGSYKGESASLFAMSGVFDEIVCVDPHEGHEIALEAFGDSWVDVKREFYLNTRHFNNITLFNEYSYNFSKMVPDKSFDFIYIDGNHSIEGLTKDLTEYIPKCMHIIGGHDYDEQSDKEANFGVVETVNKILGKPDVVFSDGSWIKKL